MLKLSIFGSKQVYRSRMVYCFEIPKSVYTRPLGLIKHKKRLILYILILLLAVPKFMQAQTEIVSNIVTDSLLIYPDAHIIKINFVHPSIQKKGWTDGMKLISKNEAMKLIGAIESVHLINDSYPNDRYLESILVEAKSKESYELLRDQILRRAPFEFVDTKFDNFQIFEEQLTQKLINLSKIQVQETLRDKGKEVIEMLKVEEVHQDIDENNDTGELIESFTFESAINSKFIEPEYEGYLINDNGEIVIEKELKISWKVKK